MTVWRGRAADGTFVSGTVSLPLPAGGAAETELCAGIRPEDVEVAVEPLPDGREGHLEMVEPLGDRVLLTIRLGDVSLRALARSRPPGEALSVRLAPERIHWFSAATGERLGRG
jgi:ABC-type sugar transport system ATPase subunit